MNIEVLLREYALDGIEARIAELQEDANHIRRELDELRGRPPVKLSKNGKRLGRPPKGEQKAMKKIA